MEPATSTARTASLPVTECCIGNSDTCQHYNQLQGKSFSDRQLNDHYYKHMSVNKNGHSLVTFDKLTNENVVEKITELCTAKFYLSSKFTCPSQSCKGKYFDVNQMDSLCSHLLDKHIFGVDLVHKVKTILEERRAQLDGVYSQRVVTAATIPTSIPVPATVPEAASTTVVTASPSTAPSPTASPLTTPAEFLCCDFLFCVLDSNMFYISNKQSLLDLIHLTIQVNAETTNNRKIKLVIPSMALYELDLKKGRKDGEADLARLAIKNLHTISETYCPSGCIVDERFLKQESKFRNCKESAVEFEKLVLEELQLCQTINSRPNNDLLIIATCALYMQRLVQADVHVDVEDEPACRTREDFYGKF